MKTFLFTFALLFITIYVMPQTTRGAEEAKGLPVGATFHLLYDEGYTIADAYDVTFTPEK